MNREHFKKLGAQYPNLRVALIGDFCLDRYLEIDPARRETSIETGLPVHNVVRVRSQPGGAGTILNNLVALGVGKISPVGFVGEDGEGFELLGALRKNATVDLSHLLPTNERMTFTYCKPLLVAPPTTPTELNRFDTKNWSRTPPAVEARLAASVRAVARDADAIIVLDQVDLQDTGVVTPAVLDALADVCRQRPRLVAIGDSRRHLHRFPPLMLKMNRSELALLTKTAPGITRSEIERTASELARQKGRPVFVTLAEEGMVGAGPDGETVHVPALPVRGPIDVVGAGDAVTANLAASLAAGASLTEAVALANGAASVVIHQLGTTGTASLEQILNLLS